VLCNWSETVVYSFNVTATGYAPNTTLTFDPSGNLYGGTNSGGNTGGNCAELLCGVIYQLAPSNGGWTENVLYQFTGGNEGNFAEGGLAMDSAGNIYAATEGAPGDCGAVVELSPSQSGWTETTIHTFEGDDGCSLAATPILDQAGNLYAITGVGGINDSGTLVEFTYTNGGWSESVRHAFSPENAGVKYGFATDSAGNFYGTTVTVEMGRAQFSN
jgi:hypothetical protein